MLRLTKCNQIAKLFAIVNVGFYSGPSTAAEGKDDGEENVD